DGGAGEGSHHAGSEWPAAPEGLHFRHDLEYCGIHFLSVRPVRAEGGRPHLHRHARGCGGRGPRRSDGGQGGRGGRIASDGRRLTPSRRRERFVGIVRYLPNRDAAGCPGTHSKHSCHRPLTLAAAPIGPPLLLSSWFARRAACRLSKPLSTTGPTVFTWGFAMRPMRATLPA